MINENAKKFVFWLPIIAWQITEYSSGDDVHASVLPITAEGTEIERVGIRIMGTNKIHIPNEADFDCESDFIQYIEKHDKKANQ